DRRTARRRPRRARCGSARSLSERPCRGPGRTRYVPLTGRRERASRTRNTRSRTRCESARPAVHHVRSAGASLMSIALRSSPEFDLIRSFFGEHGPAAHPDVRVGPGDDCAIVGDIALTTDVSIEEIHFRREWLGPAEIGFRATAAALSDLAAVAAAPVGVLVSLAVPAADTPDAARKIMEGVASAVARAGGVLLGGDV